MGGCFLLYLFSSQGDDCPYRHQPAALGNEITCELWEKGICSRKVCKFRHSVIMVCSVILLFLDM